MSLFTSEIVEEFPKLVRGSGSKNAAEREEIRALLSDGLKHKLSPVTDEKAYNALQQRIRGVARNMGVSVTVQRGAAENALYMQGLQESEIDSELVTV